MIYLQVDVPMRRWPFANWALMAVTVICSIAAMVGQDRADQKLAAVLAESDAEARLQEQLSDPRLSPEKRKALIDDYYRQREKLRERLEAIHPPFARFGLHTDREEFHAWQLITHMFVHAGFLHLLGNLLFLFCFGNAVDAKVGHLLFLAVYFGLGIIAGIGWLILGSGVMVGASGAIMGITGVFLVFYPLNEIAVWDLWWVRITGDALRIPSWLFITAYMGLDLLGLLTRQEGVAYVAHLAGESVGVAIAMSLVFAGLARSGRGERNLLELWGWESAERPPRRKKKRIAHRRRLPTDDAG